MTQERPLAFGLLAGAAAALVLAGLAGLATIYSGAYNVAATEEHAPVTRWALDTTFHNSVRSRAREMPAPPAFTPAILAEGANEYKAMCQHCHAGPGVKRAEWAQGMRPLPPYLTEAAAHWSPREVFWLVKHGVKMSGMPAFGPTHDDAKLWSLVAFVKDLPAMTPERYAAFADGHEHGGSGGHGGAAQPGSGQPAR